MTAPNNRVQGYSSLYNRGKELYLTPIYYSVFDQSEQGLPLGARGSAFCWLGFPGKMSSPWPAKTCLLDLSTQEDRALSYWKVKMETHRTFDPVHTLTDHEWFIMTMIAVMAWKSISYLVVGNEGLAYLFLIAMCP